MTNALGFQLERAVNSLIWYVAKKKIRKAKSVGQAAKGGNKCSAIVGGRKGKTYADNERGEGGKKLRAAPYRCG